MYEWSYTGGAASGCVRAEAQRAVSQDQFGLSRETYERCLRICGLATTRTQPIRRPKLGPWLGVIDREYLRTTGLRP